MTLYDKLGVDKSADDADLKKAYRGRARETHPDVGGDANEFAEVALAYSVLSDSAKRKDYDETGRYDALPPNPMGKARSALVELFMTATQKFNTETTDLFAEMRNELREKMKDCGKNVENLNREIKKTEGTIKRIYTRVPVEEVDNLFHASLTRHIKQTRGEIKTAEEMAVRFSLMLEILTEYDYRADKAKDFPTYVSFTAMFDGK